VEADVVRGSEIKKGKRIIGKLGAIDNRLIERDGSDISSGDLFGKEVKGNLERRMHPEGN